MDKDNIHLPQDADTYSLGSGLSIYTNSDIKKTISVTNNKAHYYANLAKKFRDEAKVHCDNAKHYAEENSNVTYDQLIDVRVALETEIDGKQDVGNYALKSELPVNVSELENDLNFATTAAMNTAIDSVRLPDFENNSKQFLTNDGENLKWEKIPREKMFCIKWFDHVLSFEESKGYALQGTYVYKESAPERYGYPDFYAKCLAEKAAATEKSAIKLNVTQVGSLTINNGVVSGFSNSNYLTTPLAPTGTITSFEIGFEFTTGSDSEAMQGILANNGSNANHTTPQIHINSGNILYALTAKDSNTWGGSITASLSANTHYKGRYIWNGTLLSLYLTSADGEEVLVGTQEQDVCYWVNKIEIGNDQEQFPFGGSIDLKGCYIDINGTRWWSGADVAYKNANGHIFYNIADKAIVDEIFQNQGVAWMYGIDTENERIFLPRNNCFVQATTDTSKVNQFNEAGLPNITGVKDGFRFNANFYGAGEGALSAEPSGTGTSGGSGGGIYTTNTKLVLDASKSNSIYGKSDTVQPPSLNQVLYIIVGNTEETQSLTNVTEITTSVNDTIPLFTGQYFDFKPNSPSWLKAGEQVNSGGIYTSCYNTLVSCLIPANNIYDIKVIATADMVADTDYSEYWKVNQDDTYFITPTKLSYKALNGAVKGNGITLGFNNGTQNGGLRLSGTSNYAAIDINLYDTQVGTPNSTANSITRDVGVGLTTDPLKSGIIAEEATAQLYFKVANAVQNLELLDAGEVLEAVNTINQNSIKKTSAVDKKEVLSWFAPDYANAVSFSATTFTAPNYGWIFAITAITGSGTGDAYLNGVNIGKEYTNYCNIQVFVQPEDVFTCSGSVGAAKFLPAKGV